MARGLQKIESQQKALAAKNKGGKSILNKPSGHKFQCGECKVEIDSINNMKIHWDARHAKLPTPADEFASMQKAPVPAAPGKQAPKNTKK